MLYAIAIGCQCARSSRRCGLFVVAVVDVVRYRYGSPRLNGDRVMQTLRLFVLAVSLAFLTGGAGMAAPQTLLIVAENDEISFQCDAQRCVAEVSTICLQQERPSPPRRWTRSPRSRAKRHCRPAERAFMGKSLT